MCVFGQNFMIHVEDRHLVRHRCRFRLIFQRPICPYLDIFVTVSIICRLLIFALGDFYWSIVVKSDNIFWSPLWLFGQPFLLNSFQEFHTLTSSYRLFVAACNGKFIAPAVLCCNMIGHIHIIPSIRVCYYLSLCLHNTMSKIVWE